MVWRLTTQEQRDEINALRQAVGAVTLGQPAIYMDPYGCVWGIFDDPRIPVPAATMDQIRTILDGPAIYTQLSGWGWWPWSTPFAD